MLLDSMVLTESIIQNHMKTHHSLQNKQGGGKIGAATMDVSIIPNGGKNAFIRSN